MKVGWPPFGDSGYASVRAGIERLCAFVLLAALVAVAYFLAARLGLALLTKPEDVAVFWPAAGIATGILIALGPLCGRLSWWVS